jgi:NAD(P)-dependent dehydrogenase (short-subunit alcohol dehydrogenase family)
MEIAGRSVLVTGANRGLGRAIVDELLQRGASKIYAGVRDPNRPLAEETFSDGRVAPIRLDITRAADIEAAAVSAADVTLLVNNAGVLDYVRPLELTPDVIERNMQTNFLGPYNLTRAFTPVLERNGGGAVVNVLTFLCFVAAPIFSAYNASKAASWSMAMALRPALLEEKIRIINVFPTTIETEMVAALHKPKDSAEVVARDIVRGILADADDIYPGAAQAMFEAWRKDPKAVEERFAKIS